MINFKKILFNGQVWAQTIVTLFLILWVYLIFAAFTPYELGTYRYVPNPSYDSSLLPDPFFEETCWKEGHPQFGDYTCDYVDRNPKYIVDPQGRENEIYLFLFQFLVVFSIYTYIYNSKENS